jgi:ribosomal protein S18 acetylase RimI-like enzyme
MDPLLERLDRYLDAAPRAAVRTEEIGPFTLFVNEGRGWRYYARPRVGERNVLPRDVEAVLARQRELGQPRTLEWIVDLSPEVGEAARLLGLDVAEHPLLVLEDGVEPPPLVEGVAVRAVEDLEGLRLATAVAMVGFHAPGTDIGVDGPSAVAEAAARIDEDTLVFQLERARSGSTVTVLATLEGEPAASGSHNPVGDTTELVGIATVPALRRRGLGAAVTAALVADARARGLDPVFLSAGDDDVARVYERVGFRRVGRAGAATLEAGP